MKRKRDNDNDETIQIPTKKNHSQKRKLSINQLRITLYKLLKNKISIFDENNSSSKLPLNDQESIDIIFQPEYEKLIYKSLNIYKCEKVKIIFNEYYESLSNDINNQQQEIQLKHRIVDWLTKTSCGLTSNIINSISNRKFEINNLVHVQKEIDQFGWNIIFYFMNGELSLPKEVILLILSYVDFCYSIRKRKSFFKDVLFSMGLLNTKWYLIVLESFGKNCQDYKIGKNNVFLVPIVVLRNFKVLTINCMTKSGMYMKDYEHLVSNILSVVMLILKGDNYTAFFKYMEKGNIELKFCEEIRIYGIPSKKAKKKGRSTSSIQDMSLPNQKLLPKISKLTILPNCCKKTWFKNCSKICNNRIKELSIGEFEMNNNPKIKSSLTSTTPFKTLGFLTSVFKNITSLVVEDTDVNIEWHIIRKLVNLTKLKLLKMKYITRLWGIDSIDEFNNLLDFEVEYIRFHRYFYQRYECKETFSDWIIFLDKLPKKMKNLKNLKIKHRLFAVRILDKNSYNFIQKFEKLENLKIFININVNNGIKISKLYNFLQDLNISFWNVKNFEFNFDSTLLSKTFYSKEKQEPSIRFNHLLKKIIIKKGQIFKFTFNCVYYTTGIWVIKDNVLKPLKLMKLKIHQKIL